MKAKSIVDSIIRVVTTLLKSDIPVFYNDDGEIRQIVGFNADYFSHHSDDTGEPAVQIDSGNWVSLYCADPKDFKVAKISYESIKF
jgi:hypothetical protein